MKIMLLAAAVSALTAFSNGCKKEKESVLTKTELKGTWELQQEQNGMTPTIDYPAGNNNVLTFTETTYERHRNGNLVKSGTYSLLHDTTVFESVGLQLPAGHFTTRIVYDNNLSATKVFVDLQDGKLHFVSGFFPTDGGSSQTYQRKAGD